MSEASERAKDLVLDSNRLGIAFIQDHTAEVWGGSEAGLLDRLATEVEAREAEYQGALKVIEHERAERRHAEAMVAIFNGQGLPPTVEADPDDPTKMTTRYPLLAGLMVEMEKMLATDPAATNFLTFECSTKGRPGFAVTVGRQGGKSPSAVIGELRERIVALEAEVRIRKEELESRGRG